MYRFLTILRHFFLPALLTVAIVGGTVVFDFVHAQSGSSVSDDHGIQVLFIAGENVTFTALGTDGVSMVTSSLADVPLANPPFTITTGSDTQISLVFGGRVSMRLDTGSSLQINQVVQSDDGTPHVVAELLYGHVYANTGVAGGMLDLYVNSVLVMPAFGAVSVSYATVDASFTVDAIAHSVHVAFLRPNWRQFINNADEPLFLNLFTLAEGYRTTIDPAKITDRIGSLRVSKMVKEFPVAPFVAQSDDAWLTMNASQDYGFVQAFQKELLSNSKTIGFSFEDSSLGGLVHALTVMPDKIARAKVQTLRDTYDAFFEAVLDRDAPAIESASSAFVQAAQAADVSVVTPFLGDLTADFMSVLPSFPLYPLKEAVRSINAHSFGVVASFIRDVESLLTAQDESSAQNLYVEMAAALGSFTDGQQSFDDQESYLLFAMKTALDGLFYRYAGMQTETNYASVVTLEDALIANAPDQVEAAERRQMFVATRLQLLKRLLYLGKNKVISTVQVTAFGSYLLETTEDLYVAGATTVAVNTYFAQELSSASDWLRFFQSPEFMSMTTDDDVQTLFADFLAKEQSQSQLLSYVQTGLSQVTDADVISVEDAIAEATDLLHESHIEFQTLTPLYDAENRLFSIQGGAVKGVKFSADYDRITDLFYNIAIENKSYSTGVLRKNFADFVSALIAGQTYTYMGTEPVQTVTEHSILERVAIEVVLESLQAVDIVVTENTVTITSLENQQFAVANVQFKNSDAVFSFDYSASDKQITNLSIRTLTGVQTIDGTYGLDELKNLVQTTYDAASSALFGN